MSRTPIVGGNWKCNGTLASISELAQAWDVESVPSQVDILIFPSTIQISHTKSVLPSRVQLGAQNCYLKDGAFTGETSPNMITDLGLGWVLLGHSERRHTVVHESEEELGKKLRAALDAGLKVTFCIGELEAERESEKTKEVLFRQMQTVKDNVKDAEWEKIVIAYEPVWAIGTGKVATPAIAQETHGWIRDWVREQVSPEVADSLRIQYGGSVKASNAAELASQPDIDGFLVGGAALKPEFMDICKACS